MTGTKDKYITNNKVDRQHNPSSKSKDFLNEKQKYLSFKFSKSL